MIDSGSCKATPLYKEIINSKIVCGYMYYI